MVGNGTTRKGSHGATRPVGTSPNPSRPSRSTSTSTEGIPSMTTSPAPQAPPAPARVADPADAPHEVPREVAAAVGAELVRRADEDHRLTRHAQASPTSFHRDLLVKCHRENTEVLRAIVAEHGWPSTDLVGDRASTAALMLLLHTQDLGFQLTCRDLIAEAAEDGRCPAVHHAYIADHCAVELGQPQFYGTRVDPRLVRPYPVRQPEFLDERRADVGLCPLDQQMRALRHNV